MKITFTKKEAEKLPLLVGLFLILFIVFIIVLGLKHERDKNPKIEPLDSGNISKAETIDSLIYLSDSLRYELNKCNKEKHGSIQ